jgi:hypothetical protein
VAGVEYTVDVPSGGVRLAFDNISKRTGLAQAIVLWTVKEPAGYSLENFETGEGVTEIPAASGRDPVVRPQEDADEAEWWLLTTDKRHRFIKIKLRPAR